MLPAAGPFVLLDDARPGGAWAYSPAGGPATAERLLELGRGGHAVVGGLADDLVDPALDQGEHDLEPLQRRLLSG